MARAQLDVRADPHYPAEMSPEDSQETRLRDWDDVATAISAEPIPGARMSRAKPCFVVLTGSRLGERVNIGGRLTIGRGTDADFRVSDDGVSRIHLIVNRQDDGAVLLSDADSRNGTFVNGERVDKAVLRDGDKIYIGTSAILRFSYADYLEEAFQQQMYEAALRDPLTGLFNRRHFLAQLQHEFRFVERHRTPLAVVMLDIDHFKRLNDEYGHLVGDEVLCGFGRYLRDTIRGGDVAARYGGEEFVLCCRGITVEAGVKLGNRLREQLRVAQLVVEQPQLRVTFSAGVAAAPHPRIKTPTDLVRAADESLYQAKRSGRDRICQLEA